MVLYVIKYSIFNIVFILVVNMLSVTDVINYYYYYNQERLLKSSWPYQKNSFKEKILRFSHLAKFCKVGGESANISIPNPHQVNWIGKNVIYQARLNNGKKVFINPG